MYKKFRSLLKEKCLHFEASICMRIHMKFYCLNNTKIIEIYFNQIQKLNSEYWMELI